MNVALKHLSKYLSEPTENDDDSTTKLVEELGESYKKVIEIELEAKPEGGYRFNQVRYDSFDVADHSKYLYRGGGTSGTGVTLTCKLGKPKKTDKKPKTPIGFAATALQKKVMDYL